MARTRPTKHYKKWRIRPIDQNGKRLSLTFDSFEEAQATLLEYENLVNRHHRGLVNLDSRERLYKELANTWLEKRSTQKKSPRDDISIFKAHLMPFFGTLKINQINQLVVDDYYLSRKHLSPKTLANHITLLIATLNYARDILWLEHVPRIRKPKSAESSINFRYLKTEEEIDAFLKAAAEESDLAHIIYRTAIYTGMRQGEIAGLRKSDINLDMRFITVQRSFSTSTKSYRIRHVPILDPLLEPLKQWLDQNPLELVFPNKNGNMHRNSDRIFSDIFTKVLNRSNLKPILHNDKLIPYITFHGLRHTFASYWMMRAGDIFKLQKILGHQGPVMTQRYTHLSPNAYFNDLSRLNPTTTFNNVISLQKTANPNKT